MIKRCRLGNVYTKSPAQNIHHWIVENTSKIFFAVFISIMWLVILYVMIGVVNFVGGHVGDAWNKDLPTHKLYNHPYTVPLKVIGIIGIFLYVFKKRK